MNTDYFSPKVNPEELERLKYLPTFPEFLDFLKKEYADLPALGVQGTRLTYAELVSCVARRAAFVQALPLEKGTNIGILAVGTQNNAELFLSVPASGFTAVLLPPSMSGEELRSAVRRLDIVCLFAEKELIPSAEGIGVPVLNADETGDTEAAFVPARKQTPAAIFLTSGTGGVPKGVLLSHGALMRGAYNGALFPGHILHRSYIAMLPLYHILGAVRGFLSCLLTGSLIHLCPDLRQALRDLPVLRPTGLVLVPGMLDTVLHLASVKGREYLGGLDAVFCGGASVPPSLTEQCARYGITLYPGYGLTECACQAAGNMDAASFPDSVGLAYPGQECKTVNGELWLRGDNLMLGYYNDEAQTERAFSDGWLRTGDLAEFREHNGLPYLYITGRVKSLMILKNGENVSPEELEALLIRYPEVKECLVREMGADENAVIGAEILPNPEAFPGAGAEDIEARLREIIREVNAGLPTYKHIRRLTVRQEALAKSASMKLIRAAK